MLQGGVALTGGIKAIAALRAALQKGLWNYGEQVQCRKADLLLQEALKPKRHFVPHSKAAALIVYAKNGSEVQVKRQVT